MKVPRRSLFALAVGFLFPVSLAHGRQPTKELPALPPELRLTKKPAGRRRDRKFPRMKESDPCFLLLETPEYICPIHGDIGSQVVSYDPGPYPGQQKPALAITMCSFCLFEQLKKLPVAQSSE